MNTALVITMLKTAQQEHFALFTEIYPEKWFADITGSPSQVIQEFQELNITKEKKRNHSSQFLLSCLTSSAM